MQGREQAGQRPVLVISADALNRPPLVVTVVVRTKGENMPWNHVHLTLETLEVMNGRMRHRAWGPNAPLYIPMSYARHRMLPAEIKSLTKFNR